MKKIASFLFLSVVLATGCTEYTSVRFPDAACNTAVDASPASVVVINTTNTYNTYIVGADGGAAEDATSQTATQIATAVVTAPPAPAKQDIAMLELTGGEHMLDGANGRFAWVAADGALMSFDSFTGIVRQLNKPMAGSSDSLKFYESVLALAINEYGKVAWIRHAFSTMDSKDWSCTYVMLEDQLIESGCSVVTDTTRRPSSSIAYKNGNLVWATPSDGNGTRATTWYDTMTKDIATRKQIATGDLYRGAHDVRINGYEVGFMSYGNFVVFDLGKNAGFVSTASMNYIQKADFSAKSIIMMGMYTGSSWVYLTDRNGGQSRPLDDAAINTAICTRCVALSYDDSIAVWAIVGGLRYRQLNIADSTAQFIPGASEFVLAGNMLYFIGPDAQGKTRLFSRVIK